MEIVLDNLIRDESKEVITFAIEYAQVVVFRMLPDLEAQYAMQHRLFLLTIQLIQKAGDQNFIKELRPSLITFIGMHDIREALK